jgi:hypothetical protein
MPRRVLSVEGLTGRVLSPSTVIGVLPGALLAALLTVLLAVLLAGCGGAPPAVDAGPTPLTLDQASLVAGALHRNREVGGATFVLTALDPRNGSTVVLEGQVDWTLGHGVAAVSGLRDADGEVTGVAWTRDGVAELRPDRMEELARSGLDPLATHWLRGVDPESRTLDRLIAIVLGLATERPDNAQLVLQKPDAGFVRRDVVRGVDVEVLRYSDRTVLWVDPTTGELLRFESNDSRGTAPVIVDLVERGPRRIDLPPVTSR